MYKMCPKPRLGVNRARSPVATFIYFHPSASALALLLRLVTSFHVYYSKNRSEISAKLAFGTVNLYLFVGKNDELGALVVQYYTGRQRGDDFCVIAAFQVMLRKRIFTL
jgi:hypothetical protein